MKHVFRFVAGDLLALGMVGGGLLSVPAFAGEDMLSNASVSLEAWGYGNWQTLAPDSLLNPDNRIAKLPAAQGTLESRLDVRFSTDSTQVVLRSRVLQQRSQDAAGSQSNGDAYLSQGYVRTKLNGELTFTGGREVLTWGPANFRAPSNPFYFDAGRTQPLRDVSGIDLLRFHYTNGKYGVTGAYIFDAGHQMGNADYAQTGLLKFDYRGSNYLASAIVSQQSHQAPFFGGFAQFTPNDAFLLYGEVGSGQRAASLQATSTSSGAPFERRQPSPRKITSLLGGSYTAMNGQVLSLEFLHDGHGYSPTQEQAYFKRVREANLQMNASPLGSAAFNRSIGTLGQAISQAPALLGRDYVALLWQNNPQEGALYWRSMATKNLHDHSSQASLYVEKNISPRLSLFTLVTANSGSPASEYGALLRRTTTIGCKIFLL